MPDKNGQSRLKKLFHRRDGGSSGSYESNQSTGSSPQGSPKSPPTSSGPKLRRSTSRSSLRDIARGIGRRSSQVSRSNAADASPEAQAANRSSRDGGLSSEMAGLNVADERGRYHPQHLRQRDESPPSINNTAGDRFYDNHYPRHFPLSNGKQPQYQQPGGGSIGQQGIKVRKMHPDDVFTQPRTAPPPPNSSGDFNNAKVPSQKPMLPEIPRVSSVDGSNFSTMRDWDAAKPKHVRQSSSIYSKDIPTAPKMGLPTNVVEEQHDDGVHSQLGPTRGYLVKDSTEPIDLKGIVDLKRSEDTTLHESWAPAVTHQTIIEKTHHIRQEVITREIHNHHYIHRILPIIDIEVLPARHFIPAGLAEDENALIEISVDEIPSRSGPNPQWVIAETVSKLLPKNTVPRDFTARAFEGNEHDFREWVDEKGVKRSEQWWVHPPELETGAQRSGQSLAFHFGSADPRDDGLRVRAPGGRVVGSSPLHARQMRERLGEGRVSEVDGKGVEAVPVHQGLSGGQQEGKVLL